MGDHAVTVDHVWVGAVTDTTATVVVRCSGDSIRLGYAPGSWSNPTYTSLAAISGDVARYELSGLTAGTTYVYRPEVDGTLDDGGTFTTFPTAGDPASFRFATTSCSGLTPDYPGDTEDVSNTPVWDDIAATDPLFFFQTGDLHYRDISTNTPALYRTAFDDVLAESRPNALFRAMPVVYMWDDHDFGPNNSGGNATSKPAAQQVYRERVPHYPLASTSGAIWQSFTVGRVLFILTDSRSDSASRSTTDSESKRLLGAEQEEWFYDTIAESDAPLIVWGCSTPWVDSEPLYDSDSYGSFTYERARIAEWLLTEGHYNRLLVVSGDNHANALASKGNNPWGWFPVCHFGSLDATPVKKGGPFDFSMPSRGQFGVVDITDDGSKVTASVSWRRTTIELESRLFRFPLRAPHELRRTQGNFYVAQAVDQVAGL